MQYKISISGCDDVTDFEMELNEDQFKTVYTLATLSHKNSSYGCQPVVKIEGYDMARGGW